MKLGSLVWKIPVVIVSVLVGSLAASQAGWSGAESFLNKGLAEGALFVLSFAVCFGVVAIVMRVAKPVLWVMVPILLYSALVKGVWDGIYSGFDTKRGEAIQHHWADARVLQQMSKQGMRLSCQDSRIELTDDAKAKCAEVFYPEPGASAAHRRR